MSADDELFNPLRHPVLFNTPQKISITSAWVGHIPLAYLMMDLARPRVFVELGTDQGDSYCAFCQAAAQLATATRCFAVDTWQGDPQAGFYGPDVLEKLRKHHDPLYGAFSTLVQADFDTAVTRFADASVDLLHLDGHHSYESARHDYETWRPKMSPRGVMMFHDTAERAQESFGVWRLWEELSPRHPSFEFPHAHGLGVLAVGAEPPPSVLVFLRYANANGDVIRRLFEDLGWRMYGMQQLITLAQRMARQWGVLAQWRQRTQQPPLPPLDMNQVYANPSPLAHAIGEELARLAQDDLNLRRQHPPPSA
jgi:O-antigen biosynthesis protein